FFFQAEDGIRDKLVTGVQTCALPISRPLLDVGDSMQGAYIQKGAGGQFIAAALESPKAREQIAAIHRRDVARMQRLQCAQVVPKIGRASCRERVEGSVGEG